jgi:hypothetical protein
LIFLPEVGVGFNEDEQVTSMNVNKDFA